MIFSNPKDKQKKKSSAGATGEEFFRFNWRIDRKSNEL